MDLFSVHDVIHADSFRRKKKSSKSKDKEKADKARARLQEAASDEADKVDASGGSSRNSPGVKGNKTEAEKRFEEMQRERVRMSQVWLEFG